MFIICYPCIFVDMICKYHVFLEPQGSAISFLIKSSLPTNCVLDLNIITILFYLQLLTEVKDGKASINILWYR